MKASPAQNKQPTDDHTSCPRPYFWLDGFDYLLETEKITMFMKIAAHLLANQPPEVEEIVLEHPEEDQQVSSIYEELQESHAASLFCSPVMEEDQNDATFIDPDAQSPTKKLLLNCPDCSFKTFRLVDQSEVAVDENQMDFPCPVCSYARKHPLTSTTKPSLKKKRPERRVRCPHCPFMT